MRPDLAERYFWPRRNFAALCGSLADYATARAVVLPIPYDATSSGNTAGTREGPAAIIDASQDLELYDLETGGEPAAVGIHTLPELAPILSGPEQMTAAIHACARALLDDGKVIVGLGGEHSVTLGLVQAHLDHFPDLGVLCLDAHADLRDEYLGTPFGHACVSRRVLALCPLVQVGVRSASGPEAPLVQQARDDGLLFLASELRADPRLVDRIAAALPANVYVSVDLDVFDPSLMAAVDLPEPGGLLWAEVLAVLRAVAERRRIVGADVVELSPREGPRACAFLAARLAYRLIGYATALSQRA